jgi:sensor histidine kinase YesM
LNAKISINNQLNFLNKKIATFEELKNHISIIIILFAFNFIKAQQPAYFILGENQFKGLKVFDIIQDLDNNYYFATNEGIVKYDFIEYTKIEVKSAKSVSFFNFTINKKGNIYFNNLNNQIFEIKKGKCQLFYELSGPQSANLIHLTCNNQGYLMIGCKGLIVLDNQAKIVAQKFSSSVYNTSYKLDVNTWIFPTSKDTILLYTNLGIKEQKLNFLDKDVKTYKMLQFFDYNDSTFALDLLSKKLYQFDVANWLLTPIPCNDFFNSSTNARFFITGDKIWSPSSISGVNFSPFGINKSYQNFYTDFFISDIYLDQEGNILLGTFDKGVMVIPDVKIPDVINPFSMDPMISLYTDQNQSVFMGSNKGMLYEYNNQKLKTITSNSKKPLEGIFGSPISNYLIFDDEKVKCYNKKDKKIFSISGASLKDVSFVSANEMYLGTNMGVLKVKILGFNQIDIQEVENHKVRVYSLAYNSYNKILYNSSANGLFAINQNGITQKIKYQGKDIFPEKIVSYNAFAYAVSRELGLLEIDSLNNVSIIKLILPNNDENIRNIAFYKNSFIVNTSNGLYQLNQNGEIIFQFHSVYGFSSKKVYSFSISGNDMWVSHLVGVQKINLNYSFNHNEIPKIKIQSININNNELLDFKINQFESTDRKFSFVVYSPTLRSIENIKFHYKLIGYEDQWQVQSAKINNIVYNALSPGKYTLVVKAENFGQFSPEKKYSFQILKPIYSQWWFAVLMLLTFLGLVYFIYKRQLNIQKQKSKQINELNLSKLTAIQSQMNPHFIFNSLNSIQDLVLQQNATKAYDSIGKFALLIRKIMHHSEKEFIDIEEELEMLKVYLEMELLRMKKDFKYEINSHNISDIEIPPMLIQPYIENAIKHGLLHKTGEKKIRNQLIFKRQYFYL